MLFLLRISMPALIQRTKLFWFGNPTREEHGRGKNRIADEDRFRPVFHLSVFHMSLNFPNLLKNLERFDSACDILCKNS